VGDYSELLNDIPLIHWHSHDVDPPYKLPVTPAQAGVSSYKINEYISSNISKV